MPTENKITNKFGDRAFFSLWSCALELAMATRFYENNKPSAGNKRELEALRERRHPWPRQIITPICPL